MGGRGEVGGFWSSPSLAATAGVDLPGEVRRTLGEGGTPLEPLPPDAGAAGLPNLLLKREDLNPTGSHKDRAASLQLARAHARGDRAVVISSSGNAGIATSRYAELHGIEALVCVHPATDPAKLAAIDGATTTVVVTPRAINSAKLIARELGVRNLRPSVDDDAITGYLTLGDELCAAIEEMVEADGVAGVDVVLFATSGATAIAVAERLAACHPEVARVHFVQGEGNAALADPASVTTDDSARAAAAGRLGVRHSRRARRLHEAIAATSGRGWVATDADVAAARTLLIAAGIDVSDESAANLAVSRTLAQADPQRRVISVVSGAPPTAHGTPARVLTAVDEHEALSLVSALR